MNLKPSSCCKIGRSQLAIIGMCAIAVLVAVSSGQALSAGEEQIIQTQCPVMTANKIIPSFSTNYQGKKVYFCCNSCKTAFEKNPQKYLHLLPQFVGVGEVADGEHAGHEHGHDERNKRSFSASDMIMPMGVLTLSLVAVTVCLGFFRKVNPNLLKWHKRIGPTALLVGAVHAILVLMSH